MDFSKWASNPNSSNRRYTTRKTTKSSSSFTVPAELLDFLSSLDGKARMSYKAWGELLKSFNMRASNMDILRSIPRKWQYLVTRANGTYASAAIRAWGDITPAVKRYTPVIQEDGILGAFKDWIENRTISAEDELEKLIENLPPEPKIKPTPKKVIPPRSSGIVFSREKYTKVEQEIYEDIAVRFTKLDLD